MSPTTAGDESDITIDGPMMGVEEEVPSTADLGSRLGFGVWVPQPWPAGLPSPRPSIVRWPDGGIEYQISPPLPLDSKDPMTARHLVVTGQACTADQQQPLERGPTWHSTSHSLLCRTVRNDTEVVVSFRAFSRSEAEAVVSSLQQVPPSADRS